jgi:hypothetical protein
VTGVYDGSYVRLYVNGSQEGTPIARTGNTYTNSSSILYIGNGWNGLIDDVMVYNRALSQAEITAIYNAQKPAGMAKAETEEQKLSGLASLLDAIQEMINKLKGLF